MILSAGNCFFSRSGEVRQTEDSVDAAVPDPMLSLRIPPDRESSTLGGHGEFICTSVFTEGLCLASTAFDGSDVTGSLDTDGGDKLSGGGDGSLSETWVEAMEDLERDRGCFFLASSSTAIASDRLTLELAAKIDRK